MTFPTAGANVYYNEAGEVLGWDNPGYDDGPDPDDFYDDQDDDGDGDDAWICDDDGQEFDTEAEYDRHRNEHDQNDAPGDPDDEGDEPF